MTQPQDSCPNSNPSLANNTCANTPSEVSVNTACATSAGSSQRSELKAVAASQWKVEPGSFEPPIAVEGALSGADYGDLERMPLPMSKKEAMARGWDEVDVVFVSGDAYIDHPAFATGLLARVLQANGFRVGVIAQPDWRNCDPWKEFGRPRLFFAISAGNMDSMINHYTANKKVRNDDAYSPGGKIGLRPDRATLSYCQRAREAYKGVPIVAGGVEASLRRLAHYDYWSDTVKRGIGLDAKADLVAYGMGEANIVEIAKRLAAGESVRDLRDMRGIAYVLGAKESVPEGDGFIALPSFEEVKSDRHAFATATRIIHRETNPFRARALTQSHGQQNIVCNPPRLPESESTLDAYYDAPFTRLPHPSYKDRIPAYEVVKDSVTIMRGCFGGCNYCSITTHQGRIIQSRSPKSVMKEVESLGQDPKFKGIISDIGGATANMYQMRCTRPEIEARCKRLSCVHPKICPLLDTSHKELTKIMRKTRKTPGVRKAFVASGVRMDLARTEGEYLKQLAEHHVGGHLKVAQEHSDPETLARMRRPGVDNFTDFDEQFRAASKRAGKKQYLVPYFITSHPGSDIHAMIELAVFLKQNGYKPDQVQDFIPAPFDISTCMYHTGLDPATMKEVPVAKGLRDRKAQRALLQFFKPYNYFAVRKALLEAGRKDLIGSGKDALIPSKAPPEALAARQEQARKALEKDGEHVHSESRRPSQGGGYRPGRKQAKRRSKR